MLFRHGINESNYQNYYPAVFSESKKHDRSDRYLFVSTAKLIEGLTKNGFKVVGANQTSGKVENRKYAKHIVYLTHSDLDTQNMLVGQEIPLLALKNSHGGQTALEFLESLFRKVCSNGLMLPKHDNKFAKVYHKVGMEEEVIHAAFRVIKEFPERIRNVSEMKTIDLNHDEKKVLAECAVRLAFQKSPELVELNKAQRNDISDLILRPKRFEDRQNDLWTTFNVIQENIIKGGERIYSQNEKGQLNYSKMRPVREIDRNTTLNQELMALALEMKKLKQVGGA